MLLRSPIYGVREVLRRLRALDCNGPADNETGNAAYACRTRGCGFLFDASYIFLGREALTDGGGIEAAIRCRGSATFRT